jgi:hypothetical protein
MYDIREDDCDTDHNLEVANVRERLAVSKQEARNFDMERYNLRKLRELDAGLLARRHYSEGPTTGHLDTSFSSFPCVYKRMLRRFPTLHVATACFSCSPPDLNVNLLVISFLYLYTCKITTATG